MEHSRRKSAATEYFFVDCAGSARDSVGRARVQVLRLTATFVGLGSLQLTAASSSSRAHVAASFGLAARRIAAYSSFVSLTPSSAPRT